MQTYMETYYITFQKANFKENTDFEFCRNCSINMLKSLFFVV